jgi:hypothetical protein
MKSVFRIDAYDNAKDIEERERSRFVRTVFTQYIKIPPAKLKDLWDESGTLPIDSKIKLRSILKAYNITIVEAPNGNMKIYLQQQVVAEWLPCTYTLKVDYKSLDPKNRHFTEMTCTTSSIYEDQPKSNNGKTK